MDRVRGGNDQVQALTINPADLRPPRAAASGAKLSLFEHEDGWRYQLWVTNLPVTTKGWRGKTAYIGAAHRVHAQVEDAIRTGRTPVSAGSPPASSRSTRRG